jgi:hypothetical protein
MTVPNRDGCLAVGTVIHEYVVVGIPLPLRSACPSRSGNARRYAHGISNRLTGGPANTNCLSTAQAGGMGEGWGDFFSVVFRQQPEYTRENDWPFGGWQRDMPEGIRPYPYSTKMEVNPTTYAYINTDDYSGVHAKGCVWANALYEGYWNIVEEEGFVPDLYSCQGGNGIVLQVRAPVTRMHLHLHLHLHLHMYIHIHVHTHSLCLPAYLRLWVPVCLGVYRLMCAPQCPVRALMRQCVRGHRTWWMA